MADELKPVAWMYQFTNSRGEVERPVYMDEKRDWSEHHTGWTETPLYTRPAPDWQALAEALAGAAPRFPATDAVEAWRIIEKLTADEANAVTIVAGNPDFNGQPSWAVDCNGDWTGWEDRRFADDNRLICLRQALAAYSAMKEKNDG